MAAQQQRLPQLQFQTSVQQVQQTSPQCMLKRQADQSLTKQTLLFLVVVVLVNHRATHLSKNLQHC